MTGPRRAVQYAADIETPKKRPGFLARWFLKKLTEGAEWQRRQNQDDDIFGISSAKQSIGSLRVETSIDQPERAIQFTIYSASGGRVVETRRYDRQKDRNLNGLYVITSDKDFGHEIDKIITMESLR